MSRASRSAPQAGGKEPTMNATSGPTSETQFAIYDPDSHSWKMWPAIGLWGSIEFSQTWPMTGGMRNGSAYEHPTSGLRTIGNGSSFLPTPTASDHKRNDSQSDRNRKSPGITTVTHYWPGLTEPPTSTTSCDSGGETWAEAS